jgi:DNA-binding MarR family transcriptional regulator
MRFDCILGERVDKVSKSHFIIDPISRMNRHFEPVRLGSIELFCRAAELGGFTAAAEVLGVTPGAVSRSVGRLEARLGVRLFARTTRQVRLTEDGRVYLEQCR